ncbi:A-kinase anchor protein 7-like [Acanthaster planci]|uniref:A-kinase anchor protein 7-like n=1 Tax=Acanthaster planci TaxID=133434 RepID=A0A8B8A1F5_ACAPL|nr:A-kinase anchor protein 7-like [Acanthaster planci]XP_022111503.1 A-kinase anchor protein 7-like [Acanthaster planci]XP_022111504.1 A-kinase anchor protein 7-like [Acanthaster planci]XP_022111505.1 A-kinase anchor protein 7-like [Acanthaster planci]
MDADATAVSSTPKEPRLAHRPNYFLAIPITHPVILRWVSDIQDAICERDPHLKDFSISLHKLHITLCTMHLDSEEEISKATSLFKSLEEEVSSLLSPVTKLQFQSLDQFPHSTRVLFAPPENSPVLMKLSKMFTKQLEGGDINLAGTREKYIPHMSILKGVPIRPELYKDFSDTFIGVQAINAICLCSMSDPAGDDGFYHCLARLEIHS